MRFLAALLFPLACASAAQADPYCDALMGFIHDAPHNAILTTTMADRAGPQTVAKVPLPGARCIVSPYNPTGVQVSHPAEQSVYCFLNATEDTYHQTFGTMNSRIAACMGQTPTDDTFTTRIEYNSNYGVVRVSADMMTDDWAISVTVMPVN